MRNVYSVKQVNAYIKNMFTQDFMLNRIYVKGEVSNCKYHTSGHIYFSLKDEFSEISAMFFYPSNLSLSFTPSDGMKVQAIGKVQIYQNAHQIHQNTLLIEFYSALMFCLYLILAD